MTDWTSGYIADLAYTYGCYTELNPLRATARGRVLPYINVEGTRSVELARRMGVTKQAIGRMVKELEAEGLRCRASTGSDPRAFLVRFTPQGLAFLERMNRCIEDIEREYDRLAGAGNMEAVRDALALIVYGAPRPASHHRSS